MGRPVHKDITGQRFGSWTVNGLNRTEGWRAYWNCTCDCGNKRVACSQSFRQYAKHPYCRECKRANDLIDIGSLPLEQANRVRSHESGLFSNTLITNGVITYGYTKQGQAYIIDTASVPRVIKYSWGFKGRGYVTSQIKEKERYLHNYILENYETGFYVDHINQQKMDNRMCNFRICSLQQNAFNQAIPNTNTSGLKGVCSLQDNYWTSRICFCQKTYYLGRYTSPYEAASAYDYASRILFGEYSWTNYGNIEGVPKTPPIEKTPTILHTINRMMSETQWHDITVFEAARSRLIKAAEEAGVDISTLHYNYRSRKGRGRSGYKGVQPDQKRPDFWCTQIAFNNKKFYLGAYQSAHKAAAVYDCAAEILLGTEAWLNRNNRNSVIPLGDDEILDILCKLTRYTSVENGWSSRERLDAARNRLAEAFEEQESKTKKEQAI